MDRERLQQLLESYGADPERFPEQERQAARQLLQQVPELSELVQEQAQIDALLAEEALPEPSADLRRALAEIPVRHAHQVGWRALWPFGSLWQPAMAGAAALCMGIWFGATGEVSPSGTGQVAQVSDAWTEDEEWEALSALAFAGAAQWDDEDESEAQP